MRFCGIGSAEAEINRLKLILGSKSDAEQAAELDANMLRQANIENHRLREEMAKGVTPEVLGLALYPLKQTVYDWWQSFGFLMMEGEFVGWSTGGYLNARLSCYLDKHASCVEEDQPVTAAANKKSRIEQLAESVDIDKPRGDDERVMDTERTRSWIATQLQTRFPGVRFHEWLSHGVGSSPIGTLRDIKISIPVEVIPLQATAEAA